jgi:glycosyltransferase involved in cell wall biosynthesis
MGLQPIWPSTIYENWVEGDGEEGLVSVIVPTYNRAHHLPDALASVWDQTYRPIELIVIDDGSTDETTELMEAWATKHHQKKAFTVRYDRQPNRGAPSARNLGAIRSSGEFLQFLDSDDKIHERKIESQVQMLQEEAEAGFAYCLTGRFGSRVSGQKPMGFNFNAGGLPSMLEGNMCQTSAALFRRSACKAAGPWDESLEGAQEWEFIHRVVLAADLQVCFQPEIYNYVRVYQDERRISKKDVRHIEARLDAIERVQNLYEHTGHLAQRDIAWNLALSYLQIAFLLHDHNPEGSPVRRAVKQAVNVAPGPVRWATMLLQLLHRTSPSGFGLAKRAVRQMRKVGRRLL